MERAFSLFVSAAKSGDKDANNNAGTCLEQGIGTELRPSAALFYYTKGAEQDSAQAMYSLGYLLIKSSVKSLEDLVIAKGVQSIHGQQQRIGNISLLKEKFSAPSTVGKIPLGLGSHRGPDGSAIKKDPTGGVGTVVGVGNKTSWQSNQYSSKSQKASVSQIGNNLSLSLPSDAKSYKPNFDTRNKKGLDLGSEVVTDSYTDPWLAQEIKAEEQVKEGIRWLRSAAERGILDARYQLGLVYEKVHQKLIIDQYLLPSCWYISFSPFLM